MHADKYNYERPPGRLFILSSKSGVKLADYPMPDGKETYMTPVVYDFKKDGDPFVIFGSGGETISGNLYAIRLSSIMTDNSSNLLKIADGNEYGFISTPLLTDITNDNIPDIITNAFNGRMMAFNGKTFEAVWSTRFDHFVATFSSVAPLDVNGDGVLDFFGSYGTGVWNDFDGALQVLVDGKTGKELRRFSVGRFQYSSPIVADFTNDEKNDVLLHTNHTQKIYSDTREIKPKYTNTLTVFDLKNSKIFNIGETLAGTNLCSTPLLTDLDFDNKLDIIYCINSNPDDIFSDEKLIIERKEINLKSTIPVWGAYMGTSYDGICIQER